MTCPKRIVERLQQLLKLSEADADDLCDLIPDIVYEDQAQRDVANFFNQ